MPLELNISKLDAARRQLETAIRLYFSEADPISIHTLTAAAYNVIHDVNESRGGKPMFVKRTDIIKPEHVKEFRAKINEAENFFKHGDRDADGTLRFKPAVTEYLMFDACLRYCNLTAEIIPLFSVLVKWFELSHPNLFNLTAEEEAFYKRFGEAKPGRQEFLSIALPIESQLKK